MARHDGAIFTNENHTHLCYCCGRVSHPFPVPVPAVVAPAHAIAGLPRQGSALPPLPRSGVGSALPTTQRHLVVVAIVGLHLLAVWGLLQVQAVREAAVHAAPILVSLLKAPAPPAPPPPLPTPAAKPPPPRAKPQPVAQPPVIATTASPTPESITVPPPQEAPTPTTTAPQAVSSLASTQPAVATPPAPPPAPKLLPDDAVQYLQAPQLVYPPLSMRRRETGLVIVRAYVGTEGGAPRSVQVEQSSGHPRLDQAALSAVQQARFRPYAEKGQPVEGWALIPIRFELEK